MILAITNTQEKLIRELAEKSGFDEIEVYTGIKNLHQFAIQELRSLINFKYLILDITMLNGREDEIIKSVVAIKSMHNIRIIIMAMGFIEGDILLGRIFNEGIYNFIISNDDLAQKQEFKNCLSEEGYKYGEAIRFRIEDINTSSKKIIVKKEFRKIKQFLTVGIAGAQSHIGVTTQAFLICKFFNNIGLKSCYICANNN